MLGKIRKLAKKLAVALGRFQSLKGFQARIEVLSCPERLQLPHAGLATIKVTNVGSRVWHARGQFSVRLGIHWRSAGDKEYFAYDDGRRTLLPGPVRPGEYAIIDCDIQTLNTACTYEMEFDLERRNVGWFRGPRHHVARRTLELEGADPTRGDPSFDYHSFYGRTNLDNDYWSVVGPSSKEEFEKLGREKLGFLIQLGLKPESRILDIGCGTGQLTQPLMNYLAPGGLYYGTDLVEEAIAFCRKHYVRPNFHFLRNDMESVPLEGMTFDCIYLGSVFTHMYPDEIHAMLHHMRRLLDPQGSIVVDAFVSPDVQGHVGSRDMVVVNEADLNGFFASADLQSIPLLQFMWNSNTKRCIFKLTPAPSAGVQAA